VKLRFSLATIDRGLFQRVALAAGADEKALATSVEQPPTCRTCLPFDDGDYLRPPGHYRAFYKRLPSEGHVLAVKGSELLATNFGTFGDLMQTVGMVDHFLLKELKLPAVVTAEEALEEARVALAYQQAHLAAFGTLAPVPTPLAVLQWPVEMEDDYLSCMCSKVGPGAAPLLEMLTRQQGLGVLVYHFPTPPTRVLHFAQSCESRRAVYLQAGYELVDRALALRSPLPATLRSWCRTVARMLLLGWLPTNPNQHATGQCVQPQNMGVHGAIADLDSLVRVDDIRSDEPALFRERFWHMLAELINTCTIFATGPLYPHELGPTGGGKDFSASLWRVRALVGHAVYAELRRSFDEQLAELHNRAAAERGGRRADRVTGAAAAAALAAVDPRFERAFEEADLLVGT